ncbi:RND family efflux transporter, MFP subunit [Dyadobacter koreensis]|uniref:RND family efflux transporter, MFP subunit n=1 Tax=Dyadobacter koreensis TaxID=408657 RepID=A0A1H6YW45_9BACT|nr:efflux RND transporter periplasmic adaptor subunit [Dyadobacter koreensis]SEJ43257.1 RND family efflux transporter, MFP subunit [Dyadobacter koreensis]
MKKTTIIITLAVLAVVVLIGARLVSNKKTIDEKNKPVTVSNAAIPVTVVEVREDTVSQSLLKTGNLIPYRETSLMATSQGQVLKVNFDLGSNVSQGATLIQIDNKLNELALQATQLNIDKLKKDVTRYNTLYAGNATTELQLNQTKFDYDNAVNKAEQIRKQIQDATVKSPISGRIVKKDIEVGEFVNAGTVLATILDVSRLKVQVMVNEKDVYQLREGQKVKVTADVLSGKTYGGQISYIAPRGNEEHSYPVEITVANSGQLKAGTFVNVDFSQKSKEKSLQIPRVSLVESIKNPYVYVVNQNVAQQRKLTIGRELGDNIEVLSGLQPGDQVVTTGQLNLTNGKPVQISK